MGNRLMRPVRADWSLLKTFATLPLDQLGRSLKQGLKKTGKR